MGWFQSKKYPEFWQEYAALSKPKASQLVEETRFVVFDTETTGLNPSKDRILSIGCVAINALKIQVSDHFECYVTQEQFNIDTVAIHGLLKEGNLVKMEEATAIQSFLGYIKNAVLVAHHAAFDIAMINAALRRMELPKLNNHNIDTAHLYLKNVRTTSQESKSLDELAELFDIPLHDRHTASGDAFITAQLFLKLLHQINGNKPLHISDLESSSPRKGLW